MNEIVMEDERDGTFLRLFTQPENKQCFDCGASNPKWTSVNNAVFLCFQCAGKHRTFGVHISFVRSCGLDKWNRKQLKQMELGGNKVAKAYFEKHDLIQAGQHNYSLPMAQKYRAELAKRAEAALSDIIKNEAPVKEIVEKSEENVDKVPIKSMPIVAEKKKIEAETASIPAPVIISKYFCARNKFLS